MGLGFAGMGVISAVAWNAPALTTALPVYLVLFIVAGPAAVGCSVGTITAAQVFTPPRHLGRLVGTMDAASTVGAGLGTVTAGLLADRIDVTVLLDGQAAIYLLCGLAGLLLVAPWATAWGSLDGMSSSSASARRGRPRRRRRVLRRSRPWPACSRARARPRAR